MSHSTTDHQSQWVGMIQDDNGTNGTVAVSEYCPLDYCKKEKSNVTLSEPDTQCEHNHSGILCGGCQPSLSLALGSERCLPCSNKYLALLIPLALAGPALVFCIKFLDVTISQGTLNGLIFYANIFVVCYTRPLTPMAWDRPNFTSSKVTHQHRAAGDKASYFSQLCTTVCRLHSLYSH